MLQPGKITGCRRYVENKFEFGPRIDNQNILIQFEAKNA